MRILFEEGHAKVTEVAQNSHASLSCSKLRLFPKEMAGPGNLTTLLCNMERCSRKSKMQLQRASLLDMNQKRKEDNGDRQRERAHHSQEHVFVLSSGLHGIHPACRAGRGHDRLLQAARDDLHLQCGCGGHLLLWHTVLAVFLTAIRKVAERVPCLAHDMRSI